MSDNTLLIFGISSFVVSMLSFIPYFIDIFKGKTKPERASFFLWTVLGAIFFGAQWDAGATASLWFTGGLTIAPLAVFILSLKYGVGGFETRDKVSLVAALAGLILWLLTDQPLIALLSSIFVDLAGVYLTMVKTYKLPYSETLSTWAVSIVASALAIFAVGELNFVLLAFPVYVLLATMSVTIVIIWRRPQVEKPPEFT